MKIPDNIFPMGKQTIALAENTYEDPNPVMLFSVFSAIL
jgi:hypothetical protein